MQLIPQGRGSALRQRLSTAACVLLTSTAAGTARAQTAASDVTPSTQLDASTLVYTERQRTTVYEPTVRVTRMFANRQTFSATFGVDAMTGASPTGAAPRQITQTTTSASGTVTTTPAGELPTRDFRDVRGSLDLGWTVPVGTLFTGSTGGHFSKERDYQSTGWNGSASLDVFHRRLTLTGGGGFNWDRVDPVGGTAMPFTENAIATTAGNDKRVSSLMLGATQVVTRRWLLGLNGTWTAERGYLTEPYKVLSELDPVTGLTTRELREGRPGNRTRRDLLLNSAYDFDRDVFYSSARYYWDDWRIRSMALDFRYRHELSDGKFLQPHVRLYGQTEASFFRYNLLAGQPLPAFASSDERLGRLRSLTVGTTYGFRVPRTPGEFSVRAEWLHQWGDTRNAHLPGIEATFNPFPALDAGSLVLGWSIGL